ncbi:MAG: suppressor of fused domain protein [Deltaproteobacteria bacterium]|nr:suppressor of fused domain protein [Deltaproteobacteria bacterium]
MSQAAADALVAEANELFRVEKFTDAIPRFERAAQLFPPHALAWKGLGNALLCVGRAHDAARAFDHAIGLKPMSATALWGGAVAHAEIGNKVMAQNYLRRTLLLQPTWVDMARGVPLLAAFLQVSTRAADLIRTAFGTYSGRTYRHANDEMRAVEVGRLINQPRFSHFTYVTIGLTNREWPMHHPNVRRPRVELVMSTLFDSEVCGQILANLAFHLDDTGFFPEPGAMIRDVIGALDTGELSQRLPHVFITDARDWGIRLPLDDSPPPITLVRVVPVSENEYQIWRRGIPAIEASLVQRRVDLADLRRPG